MLLRSMLVLVLGVLEELSPIMGRACSCFSGVLKICARLRSQPHTCSFPLLMFKGPSRQQPMTTHLRESCRQCCRQPGRHERAFSAVRSVLTEARLGPAPLSKGERGVEGLFSASWRSSISRRVGLLLSQGVDVRAFSATPCSACTDASVWHTTPQTPAAHVALRCRAGSQTLVPRRCWVGIPEATELWEALSGTADG